MAGRRLRVGVYVAQEDRIVADRICGPGEDVTLGCDASATLVVPGRAGPPLMLISEGLNSISVRGCACTCVMTNGEDRVRGTFEELSSSGTTVPRRIIVSKLNIKVREGISVFAKYLADGESR